MWFFSMISTKGSEDEDLLVLMNDRLGVCNMFFQFFQENGVGQENSQLIEAFVLICQGVLTVKDKGHGQTFLDF